MKITNQKRAVATLCLMLICLFFIAGCKKNDYPIDIPYSIYSLEGIQCQWQNIPCNHKVIIINSNEELEKYIDCNDSSYPAIDFEKNSLLLASGANIVGVSKTILGKFTCLAPNYFKLDITVLLSEHSKKGWSYALIVNKLHNESIIELNLSTNAEHVSNLWAQPLEVIQSTILGKWKITSVFKYPSYQYFLDNTFADISNNSFSIFGIEERLLWPFDTDSFSYGWEKKLLSWWNGPNNFTYVMQNVNDNRYSFFFDSIYNDELTMFYYPPEDMDFLYYKLVRIKN